ncbi:MAG: hypothetical protein ACP5GJ_03555 [Nanopusillaceae archaeon]
MDKINKIYIALLVVGLVLLYIGYNSITTNPVLSLYAGFIDFALGFGLSLLLLYYIALFIARREPFNPLLLFFPLIGALGYSLAKKAVTGTTLEVLGAKGPTAAISYIVQLLTGQYGTPIETIGAWLGFIIIGASIALIFYTLVNVAWGKITSDKATTVAILAGFGIAAGFVTGHLATTSFLYPFAISSGPTIYIPTFIVSATIGLLILFASVYIFSQ